MRRRLPPGWSAEPRTIGREAALRLCSPDKRSVDLRIVARATVSPRDVHALLSDSPALLLVVSSFLGDRTRELLAKSGVSYADATGHARVVVSSPGIFLEGSGAEKDPNRVPRPLQSLRGAAAARVVRALVEVELPLGVRALASAASSPLATVSRVVSFLDAEAFISRDEKKRVVGVDRPGLLARWAKDYELTESNELHTFLEPRGLPALWPKLGRLVRYAATGSTAGVGIAPPRIAAIYVDDPEEAARDLGLVAAESGANVWLLRPYDDVVFERTGRRSVVIGDSTAEVVTVAVAQAVVDLMSSPGRGPQEAAALVENMRGDEHAPRSRPRIRPGPKNPSRRAPSAR